MEKPKFDFQASNLSGLSSLAAPAPTPEPAPVEDDILESEAIVSAPVAVEKLLPKKKAKPAKKTKPSPDKDVASKPLYLATLPLEAHLKLRRISLDYETKTSQRVTLCELIDLAIKSLPENSDMIQGLE